MTLEGTEPMNHNIIPVSSPDKPATKQCCGSLVQAYETSSLLDSPILRKQEVTSDTVMEHSIPVVRLNMGGAHNKT